LRTALLHTYDRAKIFVKQAGTIILAISLILVGAFALSQIRSPPAEAATLTRRPRNWKNPATPPNPANCASTAGHLTAQASLQNSYAGQIGHWIEPVFAPLGYDWQIGIGIVSSFAAREVIVSTLAIVYGVGEDSAEKDRTSLYDSLRRAKRSDGTPIFNTATCASMLVFYILAAQCLSTTGLCHACGARRTVGNGRCFNRLHDRAGLCHGAVAGGFFIRFCGQSGARLI
jgi:ferrous iron transport protein B